MPLSTLYLIMMLTRWRLMMPAGLQLPLRLLARQQPLETPAGGGTDTRRQCLHSSPQSLENQSKDEPLPFLNSSAHRFSIKQEYVASEEEVRKSRYAIPLGFSMFAVIMYFGYIRKYGEEDKAIVDFFTKDIGDKIPPRKLKQIKEAIGQDKEISKR